MDTTLTMDATDQLARLAARDASPARARAADLDVSALRLTEPARVPVSHPVAVETDHVASETPSPGRRPMRAFIRFVLAVFIGVAGTLAWQAYGDEAREMVAVWVPQLGWLAPSPTASASPPADQASASAAQAAADQTASVQEATPAPASAPEAGAANVQAALPPEFAQQIETMARDLATARQGLEQLTAGQDQMARNIAKLQATEQDILHKLTPPARPAAAAAPRPAPPQGGPQLSSVPRRAPPLQTSPQLQSAPLPPPQRSTTVPPR